MRPSPATDIAALTTVPRLSLPAKARLAGEVVRTYAGIRRMLRSGSLPEVLAALRAGGGAPEPGAREALVTGARLGAVVSRTLPRLPVDSSCLLQSLTLTGMLARRGVAGTLVIGVAPGEEFGAHAWVEVQGRALLEPGGETFARLVEL